jgi:hypothetical protein
VVATMTVAGYFLVHCVDDARADEIAGRVSALIKVGSQVTRHLELS